MRPDLEMGSASKNLQPRRRRKRTFWRLPISVGIGTFMVFLFFFILGRHSSARSQQPARPKKPNIGQPTLYLYEIKDEFPHDASAFTQGLEFDEICEPGTTNCQQVFWESTGLYGQSTVRQVDAVTGKVLRSKKLPSSVFGEGLTKMGDRLYQITWLSNKGYSYAMHSFDAVEEFKTPLSDGWGITSNGTHLIVGDSSDKLYFLDPRTMRIVEELEITDGKFSVKWLNELEWVDGLIYANIYQTDCIAQIDPNTGIVVGWMLLDGLKQHMMESVKDSQQEAGDSAPDVLNGIAWDRKRSRLFVTGKLWPKLYQIEARPMYLDSKAINVAEITRQVRLRCIIPEETTINGV